MDLNLSPSELQFRDGLRAWLAENLAPNWRTEFAKIEGKQDQFEYLRTWQRKVYDGGWAGIAWPKAFGGRGATVIEQVLFTEEMSRAGAPNLPGVLGLQLVGPTTITHGTEAQKERFLRKILSGEEIWCQGFSEPNAGSDLAALRTDAKRDGDHFIVNGQKVWTSYGWAADWCELVVRTDADVPRHKGLTVLLVDMKSPGIEVRPLRQMTGESEFNELFFTDVRVPVENVLGKVNDGWSVAIGTLMHERATLGAGVQIVIRRGFERLVEIARSLNKINDPLVRQKLAQCYADIEIMRLNQMRAYSKMANGGTPGPEGSIQKLFWTELNQRFQQVAQEVLGPYGQLTKGSDYAIDDGIWTYSYLRARGNTIEAGTSEIQRLILGHFVLGLPKSY